MLTQMMLKTAIEQKVVQLNHHLQSPSIIQKKLKFFKCKHSMSLTKYFMNLSFHSVQRSTSLGAVYGKKSQ